MIQTWVGIENDFVVDLLELQPDVFQVWITNKVTMEKWDFMVHGINMINLKAKFERVK